MTPDERARGLPHGVDIERLRHVPRVADAGTPR